MNFDPKLANTLAALEWIDMNSPQHGKVRRAYIEDLPLATRMQLVEYLVSANVESASAIKSSTFNSQFLQISMKDSEKLDALLKATTYTNIYDLAEKARDTLQRTFGSFRISGTDGFNQFNRDGSAYQTLTGWKFHLSVMPQHLKRATEIICRIYQQHDGGTFKVTRPQKTTDYSNMLDEQAGKFLTLYDQGEKNWPEILKQIDTEFRAADIKPYCEIIGDRPIAGSPYIHYRNDGNFTGSAYIGAHKLENLPREQRYNPLGLPDPFATLDLAAPLPSQRKSFINAMSWKDRVVGNTRHMTVDVSTINQGQKTSLLDDLRKEGIEPTLMRERGTARVHITVSGEQNISRLDTLLNRQPPTAATPTDQKPPAILSQLDWGTYNSQTHGKGIIRTDIQDMARDDKMAIYNYVKHHCPSIRVITSETTHRKYFQIAPQEADKFWRLLRNAALPEARTPVRTAARPGM